MFKVLYLLTTVCLSFTQPEPNKTEDTQTLADLEMREIQRGNTPDKTDNTAQYEGSNIPEMNLNLREIKLLSNLC